jgi:hypothetical protein
MSQRVAIYARVSTLHRGWEVTAEYVDLGVSGSKA